MELNIYTDGACLGNPGPGGWGYVILDSSSTKIITEGCGGESYTTNNRMELWAAVEALREVFKLVVNNKSREDTSYLSLFTDSQYVQKGITDWIPGWKRKGWKTASKKDVANKDIWITLDNLNTQFKDPDFNCSLTFRWVKGHSGDQWNDYVDELANTKAGINS